MKILIIEDAMSYAESVIEYLKAEGHEVIHGVNFWDGKKVVYDNLDADLVIMDYCLGDGEGDGLVGGIRVHQDCGELNPSIIIGNSGSFEYNERLMKAGANDFLSKATGSEILELYNALVTKDKEAG